MGGCLMNKKKIFWQLIFECFYCLKYETDIVYINQYLEIKSKDILNMKILDETPQEKDLLDESIFTI